MASVQVLPSHGNIIYDWQINPRLLVAKIMVGNTDSRRNHCLSLPENCLSQFVYIKPVK